MESSVGQRSLTFAYRLATLGSVPQKQTLEVEVWRNGKPLPGAIPQRVTWIRADRGDFTLTLSHDEVAEELSWSVSPSDQPAQRGGVIPAVMKLEHSNKRSDQTFNQRWNDWLYSDPSGDNRRWILPRSQKVTLFALWQGKAWVHADPLKYPELLKGTDEAIVFSLRYE